jgi:mannose-6-phosphate isomerase
LEIQQNSDTTYRVYDWGRVGLDGKPRAMHVQQSLKSIKWDDFAPSPVRGVRAPATIADAREFRIRRVPLAAGELLSFASGEQPRILSVVEGHLATAVGEVLTRGDNVVLPYSVKNSFIAQTDTLVLVTENFC